MADEAAEKVVHKIQIECEIQDDEWVVTVRVDEGRASRRGVWGASLATNQLALERFDSWVKKGLTEAIGLFMQAATIYAGQNNPARKAEMRAAVKRYEDDLPEETLKLLKSDLALPRSWIKRVHGEMEQMLKEVMGVKSLKGGSPAKAELNDLHIHYAKHIEMWEQAWQICRDILNSPSKDRADWRGKVKQDFPALASFPDLIERLQPHAQWPASIAAACSERGGQDNPEDIALEHAARLCDAAEYDYRLSSLRKKYQQQFRENQSGE